MKLSQAKLKKMIREEVSRQVEEETLSEAGGFMDKFKGKVKGLFGKEEPEKQEPEKQEPEKKEIGTDDFEKVCNARQQQYENAVNTHFNSLKTKIRTDIRLPQRVSLIRIEPKKSDITYAIGFGESFRNLLVPPNFMDDQVPSSISGYKKDHKPKTLFGWADYYQKIGESAKAQETGEAFVTFWNECIEAFKGVHSNPITTPDGQIVGNVSETMGKKMKDPISLDKDDPAGVILKYAGGDSGPALVIIKLTSGEGQNESAHSSGQIIAERWQRLAGLIK